MPKGKIRFNQPAQTPTKGSSMKTTVLFSAAALCAGSLLAADPSPKDDVTAAAKKLGDQGSYAWKSTVTVPEGSQFRPGPTEGKTEKDGFTYITMSFGDNLTEAVFKGEKAVVTNQEGEWQSVADLDNSEGPGRFLGRMVRNLKTPAVQAGELVAGAKEIKKEGDTYSGDLTEEGAKGFLRFGRGGDGPSVSNAKGSVKFWLKEGALTKYEFKVSGSIEFGGNTRDVDRTTTVEIKDVGTTKVNVPEAAKKKLS
jgi:hypothetical protein